MDSPRRRDRFLVLRMQTESDEEAREAYRLIASQAERREGLAQRTEVLEVVAKSSLSGDDRATPYNPLSTQVLHHLASASDHLNTVGLMIRVDGRPAVPAMALHTLVRAAVEATSTAAWLLLPQRRDDRVLRSLRLTYDNRRQLRTILTDRTLKDPRFNNMAERLQAIRDARPGLTGVELGDRTLDSHTKRLDEASRLLLSATPTPLEVWRLTSGIAHGNSSIALNVLELSLARKVESGDDRYEATAHLGMLAVFFIVSLNYMEATVNLLEQRNTPP